MNGKTWQNNDRRTLYKKLTSGFGILESWRGMWYNTDKAPGRLKGEEASGAVNLYDLTEDIRLYFSNICCELEDGKISFCSFTARALPKRRKARSFRPSRLYRCQICEGL